MPDHPRLGARPTAAEPSGTSSLRRRPRRGDRPRAPVDRARPSGVGSIFPRRVEVGMTGLLVSPDVPLLVLVDATSTAELALVEDALTGVGDRPATVLPLRGEALAGPLADADPDTVVTAVRVAWTRRETDHRGERLHRRRNWSAAATSVLRPPPGPLPRPARPPPPPPGRRGRGGPRRGAATPSGPASWSPSRPPSPSCPDGGTASDSWPTSSPARPRWPSTGASAASSATGSRPRGTRPRRSKPAPGSGVRSAHWPPGWSFPRTRS